MTKKKNIKKEAARTPKSESKAAKDVAKPSFSLLRLLWLVTLIVILYPLFKSLTGSKDKATKNPNSFVWTGWFSGDYQKQEEGFQKKNWVFGKQYIALKNQIDFDWFKKLNVSGFMMGKENWLYSELDMKTYTGANYSGEDSLRPMLAKLKVVADTLKKKNIELVIAIAPGKSFVVPDYLPNSYAKGNENKTGAAFRKVAHDLNLNVLDLGSWFEQMQPGAKYPLYWKYGSHWSYYGECLAADSTIKYLHHLLGVNFPYWGWDKNIPVLDTCLRRDFDIVAKLNLKHPPKCEGLAYPQIQIGNQSQLNVTPVLSISDSYYRGFSYLGIQDEVFAHGDYWYYFNKIYNEESVGTKEVWELDLKQSIEKNRVIIMMATESALDNIGWGFIQQAYLLYTNPEAYSKWKQQADQLNPYKKAIRNNPTLLDELTSESQQKKIPLDTLILQQAKVMMKENKQ